MNNYLFDLRNKVVLFSGGYGYLGSACVEYISQQGANVIVLARDEKKFNDTFSDMPNITFKFCDVSQTDSIKKA